MIKRQFCNLVLLSSICLATGPTAAEEPSQMAPGQYVTKGGWATLTIREDNRRGTEIRIRVLAPDGASCGGTASLQGSKARIPVSSESTESCVVTFTPTKTGYATKMDDDSSCKKACRGSATLTQSFIKPDPGCTPSELTNAWAQADKFYEARNFQDAHNILLGAMETCKQTMDPLSRYRLLNFIAGTQFHLRQYEACINTVSDLASREEKAPDDPLNEYAAEDIKLAKLHIERCQMRLSRR